MPSVSLSNSSATSSVQKIPNAPNAISANRLVNAGHTSTSAAPVASPNNSPSSSATSCACIPLSPTSTLITKDSSPNNTEMIAKNIPMPNSPLSGKLSLRPTCGRRRLDGNLESQMSNRLLILILRKQTCQQEEFLLHCCRQRSQ